MTGGFDALTWLASWTATCGLVWSSWNTNLQRLAVNAAVGVRGLLELLERLLLGLAEERAAAGQRQDDVDLAIGGLRRGRRATNKCGGNENNADAAIDPPRYFCLAFFAFSSDFLVKALSSRF